MVFLDFEASSFSGWPIEVALAWIPGGRSSSTGSLASEAWLIQPEPDWDEAEWDPLAEEVHGLSLAELRRDGCSAFGVARAVAERLRGKLVVSDAADVDGALLVRLFEAMGGPAPEYRLVDIASLLRQIDGDGRQRFAAFMGAGPPPHRAEPDALRLAHAWLAALCWPGAPNAR
ncbi:hypothetical protein [Roseomonas sp. KE2513]|uniref:3'-5' exonuclease n=1 Tax=Roseomonas sp. KE2513 TaxID=2479202 RepID=UPI0018DFD37E|nr:hypothetical protein [Roseomonas sp. KE2513]